MSTHPRDYPVVESMASQFRIIDGNNHDTKGIACYGVHPWFLHEVLEDEEHDDDGDANS